MLRLAVWNCYRGEPTRRWTELARFDVDIAIFSEAKPPLGGETERLAWWPQPNALGTAVVARDGFQLTSRPALASGPRSAAALEVKGLHTFNLLAVWAFAEPTYARGVASSLEAHADFLASGPSIVAGDLNGNTIWDKDSRSSNHTLNVQRLESDFGLVSAYHSHFGEGQGAESRPTHYHQWKREKPFHIDYCFVPRAWRILSVSVPPFEEYGQSDHRPLIVELEPLQRDVVT